MQQDENTQRQKVMLGNDMTAYIEILPNNSREEVGVLDALPFEQVTAVLGKIADGIGGVIQTAKPSKASVELGMEFSVEEGKLVSIIARGTGKANIKINLEWEKS